MERALQEELVKSIKNKNNPYCSDLIELCHQGKYNELLLEVVTIGWTDIVDNLYRIGANNFNKAMLVGCRQGRYSIIPVLINHGANNLNQALITAAKNGKLGIVCLLVHKGANAYDKAIEAVTDNMFGTHREIQIRLKTIEFLEKKKAKSETVEYL